MNDGTCDNLFAPDCDNPDIDDLIVLWARDRTGLRNTGWPRAMANFFDNHGWTATAWFLDNAERLSDERYLDDPTYEPLFGVWDCEVNSTCYCAYKRAGLSPVSHMLVRDGDTITFLNPRTREIFDEHGTVIGHDTSGVQTGV